MGLTFARELIVAAGGTIGVDLDKRRSGANIRLTLPRKRSKSNPAQPWG